MSYKKSILIALSLLSLQNIFATDLQLTTLQNKDSHVEDFRTATKTLGYVLAGQVSEQINKDRIVVETPLAPTLGCKISGDIILVPVIRSGIALLDPFLTFFPKAKVGFIGLERDEETAEAHCYYYKVPKIKPEDNVVVLEPMLATGGSAAYTIKLLLQNGATEKNTTIVGVIGAIEGIRRLKGEFPKLNIITAELDPILNEQKFIVPGLGDYGDRFFDTEVGTSGLELTR